MSSIPEVPSEATTESVQPAAESPVAAAETPVNVLPVIALVGRPNVGKSTLFNRFTNSRDALVADYAGLTRDRQYGQGKFEDKRFIVVDTGGLMPESDDALAALAEAQARIAIEDADTVLFLVDAKAGLMASDIEIASVLRKLGKPVRLLANKSEGMTKSLVAEFYKLGLGEPTTISAEHGDGIGALLRELLANTPAGAFEPEFDDGKIRVAIVGRPNAGKSTLVNRLIGENRVLSSNEPGTTRDSISVPFEWGGKAFELIDTAGIRRKARVTEVIEKFSIVKTLQAIDRAHVVIAMVDAHDEIGTHDARVMGLVAHHGRAMVLAVNKWDGLDTDKRKWVREMVDFKLPFLDYVPVNFISALHGSGLRELMEHVVAGYEATTREMPTPELNRVLIAAIEKHAPHAILGRRIKLRYCHQTGRNPPEIMIHGNQTDKLKDSYKSYLANTFRDAFKLKGVPLKLEFKTGDNPFKNKKSDLSQAMQMKKKRLAAQSAKTKK
ncbi:ribosome biogenesis GTPase Der [Nevskia sp.]|uniref:ribosome biogenesis GTPase Der n=1 Tax=Nevskia sp. TaxID=1929292 RepID=UPI0034592A71